MSSVKKIKISVTLDDIASGVQSDPSSCPIARAVRRVTKTHKKVQALDYELRIGKKRYVLPDSAFWFITYFDSERSRIKPFSFSAEEA